MFVGRHGGGWQAFDSEGDLVQSVHGRQADREHLDDFLKCVRDRSRPNADVEFGHQTALLCHIANVSYRVGNQKLNFDGQSETFEDNAQANAGHT